jgi:hypothetical protein
VLAFAFHGLVCSPANKQLQARSLLRARPVMQRPSSLQDGNLAAHATFCAFCCDLQEVFNIDFERFIQVRLLCTVVHGMRALFTASHAIAVHIRHHTMSVQSIKQLPENVCCVFYDACHNRSIFHFECELSSCRHRGDFHFIQDTLRILCSVPLQCSMPATNAS